MILACGFVFGLCGGGCAFGPRVLEHTHGKYYESVRLVNEEELLRNLIHMRYNEFPLALNVSSIAAQYELPSLTTMRQRVTLLAREAMKLALTGIGIDISTRRHLLRRKHPPKGTALHALCVQSGTPAKERAKQGGAYRCARRGGRRYCPASLSLTAA